MKQLEVYHWFLKALYRVWDDQNPVGVDWKNMENFLAAVLLSDLLTDAQKVRLCKMGVDAFTRRKHFTSDPGLYPVE